MKILKLTGKLLAFLIIIAASMAAAAFLMQDEAGKIILSGLNRSISTRVDVRHLRLSFLRRFPKASFELSNVLVHSSTGFDKAAFGINSDTLLFAESVSLELRLTDALRGNYIIESVTARNGILKLLTDREGKVNYEISSSDTTSDDDTYIDLRKTVLENMLVSYRNLATEVSIRGNTGKVSLRSRIKGSAIDFNATGEFMLHEFILSNARTSLPVQTKFDVDLRSDEKGVKFNDGILEIDDYRLGLNGIISSDNILDLNITGRNIEIASFRKLLPGSIAAYISKYNPSGRLLLSCNVKGAVSRTNNPHVEMSWTLEEGKMDYAKSGLSLRDLALRGSYTNGQLNSLKTSKVSLSDIRFKLGKSDYTGTIIISDLTKPHSELAISGNLNAEELENLLPENTLAEASGSIDADIRISTSFWPGDSIAPGDLLEIKPSGTLTFRSLTLGIPSKNLLVENVNGSLSLAETIKAASLEFTWEGQRIKVTGEFRNLPEWLCGRPVTLIAKADVSFDKLNADAFKISPSSQDEIKSVKGIAFPDNIILDLDLKIGNMTIQKLTAEDFMAAINYRQGILTFNKFNMNTLDGLISGKGFIIQKERSMISKGDIELSGIDVNKAFTAFNNFGQKFILAENLSGTLSGNVSVLIPGDRSFNPNVPAISAEGRFILEKGSLIDFDPVKELSSFIEMSELENIHFQKIENDFFIRNNVLFLPQMDVRSTAADLSVNGRHSFDNKYEYHVKMLLSQLLSRKRKKNPVTEFGAVQDDGLGRTSLLLKVESKGDEMKVGYDVKAAGQEIKNNLKAERKNLKNILNQEYGWYKDDPETVKAPAEKKQRFTITWEETEKPEAASAPETRPGATRNK